MRSIIYNVKPFTIIKQYYSQKNCNDYKRVILTLLQILPGDSKSVKLSVAIYSLISIFYCLYILCSRYRIFSL